MRYLIYSIHYNYYFDAIKESTLPFKTTLQEIKKYVSFKNLQPAEFTRNIARLFLD